MIARVLSTALVGVEARPVFVEVHILGGGLPEFNIVGLPSAAVREARQRVRSAIINSNEGWPNKKITANLAPGDLRKDGSLLDLPIAIGVLMAEGRVKPERAASCLFLGELSLDGRLRRVKGALAAAVGAREMGVEAVVVPEGNFEEASLVPGVRVVGAGHLIEAVEFANGTYEPPRRRPRERAPSPEVDLDLADVRGQALARRALEIAAVGGHNILLIGPPGSGKTMLARRLPGILPPLTDEESLEVTRVWSVAGLLEPQELPIRRRPFRAPHHHASAASIVGGGSGTLTPGEVSLAHRGVLFMDELPLFSRHVLEALRQPLEDGSVTVARRDARVRFPARFALVGAANPCLCEAGAGSNGCLCTGSRLERYRSRLSGPLLDRIDLHVEVARLTPDEMMDLDQAESTGAVACRVSSAIDFRILRSSESGETSRPTDLGVRRFLGDAIRGEMMTARGYARTLRVARTIADLALSSDLEVDHVAEAMQFRQALWSRI